MLTLLITYLILLIIVFFAQRKLIYFPQKYATDTHQETVKAVKLKYWPNAKHYRALIKPANSTQYRGTVLVFHGNAGSAVSRLHYFNALENIGYRVIVAEYPGYGARSGTQTESLMIEDAINTTQQVYQQYGEPLYLSGESLGAGVVSGVIAQHAEQVKGLLLITPFDNLPNLAHTHYGWLLAKWLTLDQFNNIENLKQYPGKVAVVMATQDRIIPNKHSLNLFKALTTRKQLWQLDDSDHNNWPGSSNQQWWREVMKFIES